MRNTKHCLALFSGGLDSMLACKIISLQGVKVTALHFDIGVDVAPQKLEILAKHARAAGAEFRVVDVQEAYLQEVLFSPKYGYGKAFNPCVDCHGFMFRQAILLLDELDASFVISGEVVGQRPMSQRADAMAQVRKLAGCEEDLILRPLCAKNLKPTLPELQGWVSRERLYDFSGRGRERQLALAKEFGFADFESPGGGCAFTMADFATKIMDFLRFEGGTKFEKKSDLLGLDLKGVMTPLDLQSLRFGRHLRLPDGAKLIIGRDQSDNERIDALNNPRYEQVKFDLVGAHALLSANASPQDKLLGARLVLTYCRFEPNKSYTAKIGEMSLVGVTPFESKEAARKFFIL